MTGPAAEGLPTGTVTFLFTDIEGSTPLWDAHPMVMRETLARHDEIMRTSIDAAGGHVFSTGGDGFAAVFASAGNAVVAALEAQQTLSREPWPDGVALRVRMGVHTGEVQERDGDYFGLPVNRAARLMGAAHGGQVVMSALTAELLDDSVGVDLIDLGSVQLKGVVEPVHVFGATAHGAEWIDRPLVSAQTTAGNLPRPHTELVGDLADLQRRVSNLGQARVVTLTGSGGVGKTRAAIEIGWLVLDEFPDGVWLVDLAPIADPEAVIAAAAATLMVQPRPGESVADSIADWCLGRRRLLIFDNCEHVLAPVMALVSAIVAGCETVTIVATSREPLGLDGERVIRIPSLDQNYGVELFCARSVAADSSFAPSSADEATIATICDRLDGIPLAIELAAARTRALSPEEVLQRLDDRFRLLRGGGRGGLERHQTLRATVTWSYQLLSTQDQLLFDRLSVFAGGFTVQAAEAICTDDDVEADDVIDLIGELVDKSMLIAERTGSTTRYRMLETLRQYGEERLDDRCQTTAIRDRHLAHFRDVAYGIDEVWWSSAQLEVDEICDREWDNFRAAHQWAIISGSFQQAVDIINGISSYIAVRLRIEAEDWTSRTIELGERDGRTDGFLFAADAFWAWFSGDPDRAAVLAERGLAISHDEKSVSMNQMMQMIGIMFGRRFDEAPSPVPQIRSCLATTRQLSNRFMLMGSLVPVLVSEGENVDDVVEEYGSIARAIGSPYALSQAQLEYGNLLLSGGQPDLERAIAAYLDAIRLAVASHSDQTELWARASLAYAYVTGARNHDASRALSELIGRSIDARYVPSLMDALETCVVHFSNVGQTEAAATIMGRIELHPSLSRASLDVRERTQAAIYELPNLDALTEDGASMELNEIVTYALAHLAEG